MLYQLPTVVICNGHQCNVHKAPHEDDISYLVQHAVDYSRYTSESMRLATQSSEHSWLVFATEHVLDALRQVPALERLPLIKANKVVVALKIDRNGDVIGVPWEKARNMFLT